ncbi:MAG: hypothetical protein IPL49_21360, partial [Saprospirales bacterium]|nr:hypothetical protein [Saprospirales bacterium]
FYVPEATAAVLTIWDVQGQQLYKLEGKYDRGYHEVRIDDMPATGVLYYRLDTPAFTATRKMIQTK